MPSKLVLAEFRNIALGKGGLCLSSAYTNTHSKLRWRCSEGHEWLASPNNVKRGRWCPQCFHSSKHSRKRLTIERMHALAEAHQGKFLSESYEPKKPLIWQCSEGHLFEALASYVAHYSMWCPKCSSRTRYTIEDARALASTKKGQCLSSIYSGVDPLTWQCSKGHTWNALAYNVLGNDSWCPYCSHRVSRTIEEMRDLAKSRGGICLSPVCDRVEDNLTWRCAKGHEWQATPHAILGSASRIGTWCPRCMEHTREKECRTVFETLFGAEFPKSKPLWLCNSRGNRMELDGYSESLRLAFEYQGIQHYIREFLHSPTNGRRLPTEEEFAWQQQRDQEKRDLCLAHSVTLIEVPWYTKSLKSFIREQIICLGLVSTEAAWTLIK